ncbi:MULTISPECIES: hypothetical protein [Stenotrophomonas]|nr:hypothetical protein [Stenotrophomonas sp. SKA14]
MSDTTAAVAAPGADLPIVHVLMGFICVWHRRDPEQARDGA